MDALAAGDLAGDAHRVRCPVLLIAARDDMLVPFGCTQALADALTHARVTIDLHATGGHAINVTQPARFEAALLDFLAGVAAGITQGSIA